MDEQLFAQVTVSINSGSSLVVKKEVLRILGIDPGTVAVNVDSAGNITSMIAVIARAGSPLILEALMELEGVSNVVVSAPPSGLGSELLTSDILGRIHQWVLNNDIYAQFAEGIDGLNGILIANHYSGSSSGVEVAVYVTDGNGKRSLLNDISTIRLTISGGTAASPKINGSSSPATLTMLHGRASAQISASSAGTVTLGLSSPTHPSVTLCTDTATVALS